MKKTTFFVSAVITGFAMFCIEYLTNKGAYSLLPVFVYLFFVIKQSKFTVDSFINNFLLFSTVFGVQALLLYCFQPGFAIVGYAGVVKQIAIVLAIGAVLSGVSTLFSKLSIKKA